MGRACSSFLGFFRLILEKRVPTSANEVAIESCGSRHTDITRLVHGGAAISLIGWGWMRVLRVRLWAWLVGEGEDEM